MIRSKGFEYLPDVLNWNLDCRENGDSRSREDGTNGKGLGDISETDDRSRTELQDMDESND